MSAYCRGNAFRSTAEECGACGARGPLTSSLYSTSARNLVVALLPRHVTEIVSLMVP
jgi:hypothetical protein